MHIPLRPETDERLRREAARRGLQPEDFVCRLIESELSGTDGAAQPNQAALQLLDQWDREDETDDPAEIARRQEAFEEFKAGLNASHSSNRKTYP
jgi:hypothetical protein